jgi:putative sigma-54 modulation protein
MHQLSVTFRHMDATDPLKTYANEKVERINKYFPDPIKAHVVLSCERGYNHVADVTITLHNGIVIKGVESTEDMYSSIDLVMAKIERQVRRYKERIKSHRPVSMPPIEVHHSVVEMPGDAQAATATSAHKAEAPGQKPKVIRKSKFVANPLSIEEAVMQMNLLGNNFLVFTNAETRQVAVVYKREDDTYGLIETGAAVAHAAAAK